jgi:hypothetical protein
VRYALMLTLTLASLAFIGTTGAQETGIMSLSEFADTRIDIRDRANTIRSNKCHSKLEFTHAAYEIAATKRAAVLSMWRNRVDNARELPYRCYAVIDTDFHSSARFATNLFNISYSWLHGCAHAEGGDGRWVSNTQGSGAGGWMQFMSGTFYGNVDNAFASANAKLARNIPARYKSWYSRLGQAVTAAYMFRIGQSGQWTGAAC